jgi:hypothetical protein
MVEVFTEMRGVERRRGKVSENGAAEANNSALKMS